MTQQETIHYVDAGDVRDDEGVRDLDGRPYDEPYVEELVGVVRRDRARRGRPSLAESGTSPQIQLRVPPDLKSAIDAAAEADHMSRADWMRRVLKRAAVRRVRVIDLTDGRRQVRRRPRRRT